jgi:hypothetical protein
MATGTIYDLIHHPWTPGGTMDDFIHGLHTGGRAAGTMDDFIHGHHKGRSLSLSILDSKIVHECFIRYKNSCRNEEKKNGINFHNSIILE